MSYPGPSWRIRGAANFRSESRQPTSPNRAALDWLGLADAIVAAGGDVVVLPPAETEPPFTGMLYTANAGALFPGHFLTSRMHVEHRGGEFERIEALVNTWGVEVSRAEHTWEGQAEIATLTGHRYILSFGVRSVRESMAEVEKLLPEDAHVLEVELRDPYFHGDTCMAAFDTPKGQVLLACQAALVDRTLEHLAGFAPDTRVIPISEQDALAYACNALAVGDRWLVPQGVSTELKRAVEEQGMHIDELELSEVFGKGGGGPRCMVNDLTIGAPLPEIPEDQKFVTQRAALRERFASYPDEIE